RPLDQGAELRNSWRDGGERLNAVTTEDTHHATHIEQCFPSALLDLVQSVECSLTIVARNQACRLGLDDHHAHTVGDHIVELPGDPGPLVGRRSLLALSLLDAELLEVHT